MNSTPIRYDPSGRAPQNRSVLLANGDNGTGAVSTINENSSSREDLQNGG